jgi:hypothetical protein
MNAVNLVIMKPNTLSGGIYSSPSGGMLSVALDFASNPVNLQKNY